MAEANSLYFDRPGSVIVRSLVAQYGVPVRGDDPEDDHEAVALQVDARARGGDGALVQAPVPDRRG